MVTRMNKIEFIEELSKELTYSKEQCSIINDVLENNFFLSNKNKDKIIQELVESLHIDMNEANEIYDCVTKIIKEEIKEKIKHPFRSQK